MKRFNANRPLHLNINKIFVRALFQTLWPPLGYIPMFSAGNREKQKIKNSMRCGCLAMAASCSPMVMTLWTQKNCLVNANDGDHGRPFSTTTTTTEVGVLSGALFFSFSLVATLLCEWMISQTTVTTGGGGLHDSRTSPYGHNDVNHDSLWFPT